MLCSAQTSSWLAATLYTHVYTYCGAVSSSHHLSLSALYCPSPFSLHFSAGSTTTNDIFLAESLLNMLLDHRYNVCTVTVCAHHLHKHTCRKLLGETLSSIYGNSLSPSLLSFPFPLSLPPPSLPSSPSPFLPSLPPSLSPPSLPPLPSPSLSPPSPSPSLPLSLPPSVPPSQGVVRRSTCSGGQCSVHLSGSAAVTFCSVAGFTAATGDQLLCVSTQNKGVYMQQYMKAHTCSTQIILSRGLHNTNTTSQQWQHITTTTTHHNNGKITTTTTTTATKMIMYMYFYLENAHMFIMVLVWESVLSMMDDRWRENNMLYQLNPFRIHTVLSS